MTALDERFRLMADGAPVMLWMAGTDSRCDFFNEGWLRFSRRTMEEEIGEGWAERVHFEDLQRCMCTYLDAFVARRSFAMEYRLRRGDGSYRWIYDQGAPRYEPDGTFAGYIGSCIDITEDKEAQLSLERLASELRQRTQDLDARLREREVLLLEMNHRVKNNLQLISSLLNIQARKLTDAASRSALEQCRMRVLAIGLLHEDFDRSRNYAAIAFGDYARKLVGRLVEASAEARSDVALDLRVQDLSLPIGTAIPCGLVLNELITNAFKHAFPQGRAGSILVEFAALEDNRARLAVTDDGVGLTSPDNVWGGDGVGLQIVGALAEQLKAEIDARNEGGASFELRFALEPQ